MSDHSSPPPGRTFWQWLRGDMPVYPPSDPPIRRVAASPPAAPAAEEAAPVAPPVPATDAAIQAVSEQLADLLKELRRSGREQFKLNTLYETQQASLQATVASAQQAVAQQHEVYRAYQQGVDERLHEARLQARCEALQELLPTLDSLDEAIRAGHELLAAHAPPVQPAAPAQPTTAAHRVASEAKAADRRRKGWLSRMLAQAPPPPAPPVSPAPDTASALYHAMQAWLDGLEATRTRLLTVLQTVDIQPLAAAGQPFDPHYHRVLDVTVATATQPAGTIVSEYRRGYRLGDRVLRLAEVVVATDAPPTPDVASA